MIAGLLAVFLVGMQITVQPQKMSLASLRIVCQNGALTSNVDQKSGSEFGSSDVFCWLLPCWKHPWIHHFSIFHHFFTVFLPLSPSLQSFLPSFLIFHHLFMVSPHFHAFSTCSCRFSLFFPTFHQKSPRRLTSFFFHPGPARCFGLRQPGAVPRAGPGRAAQRDVGRRAAARVLHRGGRGAR